MHALVGHRLYRSRRCQTRRSAPTSKAHQHGLGDVVLVVPEPNDAAMLLKKRKPGLPRFGFTGVSMCVPPFAFDQSNVQLRTDSPTKRRIRARFAPAETMVEVQGAELAPPLWPMSPEQQ